MLETQAGLLMSFLQGYQMTDNILYRSTAQDIIRYVMDYLWEAEGPWFCGSQTADQEYYQSSEEDRDTLPPPAVDRILYTDQNAMMVRSLLKASVLLKEPHYQIQALKVLDVLMKCCLDYERGVMHYYDGRSSQFEFHLPKEEFRLIHLLPPY